MSAARVGWQPAVASRRLALLAMARGGSGLLGLATVLVIARALNAEQLGCWSLALAIQGYALHLGEFGLRGVVTTEAARSGSRLPELLSRYLGLRLALSAIAIAVVLLGCALARPADLPLVGLVALAIVPIALQLDWLALVDDRIGLAAALLLVRPLAFLALLALLPAAHGTLSIAWCFLAAWLLAAIASWAALDRPAGGGAGVLPSAAAMLRRGSALAVVTLTNQAQLSADLLAVGWVLGAARAGDYYLAGQILVAALLFANAAGQIALARLPALAGDPERLRSALAVDLVRLLRFATIAGLTIAVVAPPLLPALFGAEHAGAARALLWLLPWFVLQHPTTLMQAALTAAGREAQLVRGNAVAIAVLLPGLALAATGSGLAGFAAARSAAEAARLIMLWLSLRSGQKGAASAPLSWR